jgi:TonB-dependent starch-binding outer membrane protein SusC
LFRPEDVESTVNGKVYWKEGVMPYKVDSKGKVTYAQNYAKPGDIKFVDINGDSVINANDKAVIGNPNPKFTFGFTLNLEYKGFDLSCFFQGSYGNDIYNAAKGNWYHSSASGNWVKDALNAYHDPVYDTDGSLIDPGNTTSNQFNLSGSADNLNVSDWYIEDGSYVRLKSIQIGYTIPATFSKKYRIERLRVYVGGKNLVTWTKYSGLDPEIGGIDPTQFGIDNGVYPQAKMYSVGLNLSF